MHLWLWILAFALIGVWLSALIADVLSDTYNDSTQVGVSISPIIITVLALAKGTNGKTNG